MAKVTKVQVNRQARIVADLTVAWLKAYSLNRELQDELFDKLLVEAAEYRWLTERQ